MRGRSVILSYRPILRIKANFDFGIFEQSNLYAKPNFVHSNQDKQNFLYIYSANFVFNQTDFVVTQERIPKRSV